MVTIATCAAVVELFNCEGKLLPSLAGRGGGGISADGLYLSVDT